MSEHDYITREHQRATAEEIRRWEMLDIGRKVDGSWRSWFEGEFLAPDEDTISRTQAKHVRRAWNAATGRADIEQAP